MTESVLEEYISTEANTGVPFRTSSNPILTFEDLPSKFHRSPVCIDGTSMEYITNEWYCFSFPNKPKYSPNSSPLNLIYRLRIDKDKELLQFSFSTNELEKIMFVSTIQYNILEKKRQGESIHKILDYIFEQVEDKLISHEFEWCNALLNHIDISELDIDVIIGLLTLTLPWKHKLYARKVFYYNVRTKLLLQKNIPVSQLDEILYGLE